MNPETIKTWLKSNRKDRQWLADKCGVHKQTVDGWLSANRTISAPAATIIRGLMKGSAALNPRLTLEEYNRAQSIAHAKGQSLEDWISELIKGAIKLLIAAGLIWLAASCAKASTTSTAPKAVPGRPLFHRSGERTR